MCVQLVWATWLKSSARSREEHVHVCALMLWLRWSVQQSVMMAATAPQATTCLTTPVCSSATVPATTRGCSIHRVPVCPMIPATTGMYSHDSLYFTFIFLTAFPCIGFYKPSIFFVYFCDCFWTALALMERCSVEQLPALVRWIFPSSLFIIALHKSIQLTMLNASYMNIFYPVDCGWSEWTSWSACSRTCDVGIRRRYRSGTNPPQAFGGLPCVGDRAELDTCSIYPCSGKSSVHLF